MSKARPLALKFVAGTTGAALFAYLVFHIGPGALWNQTLTVGWRMAFVLFLAGVAHYLKSTAWRFTFPKNIRRSISGRRALGLRLISEAIGQFGLPGQVAGEGVRVSLLGPSVPLATRIASATIDRGLFILSSAIVGVTGLVGAVILFPLPHVWKTYAFILAGAMFLFLLMTIVAVWRQWSFVSAVIPALHRIPRLSNWLMAREETLYAAEQRLLSFHAEEPASFWTSFALNLAGQVFAILEVYLLLWFMHSRIAFVGAFVFEAFTKLVNAVGGFVPGNVGTYEGGNMLIARLFGVTGAVGLAVGVCRRIRALFWAAVGGICLLVMSRSAKAEVSGFNTSSDDSSRPNRQTAGEYRMQNQTSDSTTFVILSGAQSDDSGFIPALAPIGTLPAVLRIALSAQNLKINRTILSVQSRFAPRVECELLQTRRVPTAMEWYEYFDKFDLGSLIREASLSGKIVLVLGDRCYPPSLLRKAAEWNNSDGALAFRSGADLIGIFCLSPTAAHELAHNYEQTVCTLEELRDWAESHTRLEIESVDEQAWQQISSPADLPKAEAKLNTWLVKPTDGLFARMNRRVSIPISRWLLQWPITPNMVTLFTLGVSFAAGLFFAFGGYWATLLGALLSVWASILDGCDGEVARLKLQVTDFGCWLETVCDYLYYIFIFGGMLVGFNRTIGSHFTLRWGPALFFGAVASFLAVGFARHHFAASRPEAFLSIWQGKAEQRKTNPLLYVGRYCEFMVRRCFLPYAFLFFAVFNILRFAFIGAAVGANIVWCIALYSCFTLSRRKNLNSFLPPSEPRSAPAAV